MNISQTEITIENNCIEENINNIEDTKKNYKIIKRTLDIIISGVGLVILFPFLLVIAIAIKIDSKGPILFKHKRIGKDGKTIYIYKYRTMLPNAEEMIKDFNEEQLKEFKENYKLKKDPRITKVGRFLRKTSLDELPQLINILKGELSIVGPRPVIQEELERYGENADKFLSVMPGLTGYWQANGRSLTTYEQRMKMELYYVENCTLLLDIKIFFKTIFIVFKKEGAI